MAKMIYKLQWPITSSDPNPMVLAYTEKRDIELLMPCTPELRELFGDYPKIFRYCILENLRLKILEAAPDQDW